MKYKAMFSAGLLAMFSGGVFIPLSQASTIKQPAKLVEEEAPEIETEEWTTTNRNASMNFTVTDWGSTETGEPWSPSVYDKRDSNLAYTGDSGNLEFFKTWKITRTGPDPLNFTYNLTVYDLDEETTYNNVHLKVHFFIPNYEEGQYFVYSMGEFTTTSKFNHDNEIFPTFELVGHNWYGGKNSAFIFFNLVDPGQKENGTPFDVEEDIYPALTYLTYQNSDGETVTFTSWKLTYPEDFEVDSDYALMVNDLDNLTLYRNTQFHVAYRAHNSIGYTSGIDYYTYGVDQNLFIFTI